MWSGMNLLLVDVTFEDGSILESDKEIIGFQVCDPVRSKKALRTFVGTPMLPRCLPRRQSGSRNGSETRQIWSPDIPRTRNDSLTSLIYAEPSCLDPSQKYTSIF